MTTKIYKILSYILLVPAAFLSIMLLFSLVLAIANPAVLLLTFILACVIIYTFVSFNFLQKVIIQQKTVASKLKDWVKVNAYVTLLFALMMIFNTFSALRSPLQLRSVIKEMLEQQKNNPNIAVPENMMYNATIVMFVVFLVYSVLLLTHLFIGFKLLQKHNNQFSDEV